MLHATLALARRVDRAEIDFCALAAGVGLPGGADTLEVAGARALCLRVESPLNKVLGLGLGAPVADADLERLSAFYAERQQPAQVELCPLAPPDLAARLVQLGFVPRGFENQLGREAPLAALQEGTPARVRRAQEADDERWLRIVSRGFACAEGRPAPTPAAEADAVEALATMMRQFVHPAIARYVVELDGKPAGAGASYVQDRVLAIVGTATLPEFRRRGVQHALVRQALQDGVARADLATATVEPGSTSQRTFERLGFRVLYTRTIFVRPCAAR